MANEIILFDYEISNDCCNEDSFGYVCLKCGQCGRKFANGMLQKEGADNGKKYAEGFADGFKATHEKSKRIKAIFKGGV